MDFTLAAGERLGIVGESGSGKSTLLRILAGLDQPTSGSAVVAGTEVAGARENRLAGLRRQLQIVFQDPMGSLDPRMRVRDIVGEPLLVPGQALNAAQRAAKVAEMLLAVGLDPESAERFPHQFSGGQRQRISIARALICRPRVLVADEPVSALDVSVRAQVLNLLADLVDEYALTLLFVSHDLAVVRHLCDRVIVMKDGEIVEAGPTEDVYNNPRHPYTRELIASSLNLREQVASLRRRTAVKAERTWRGHGHRAGSCCLQAMLLGHPRNPFLAGGATSALCCGHGIMQMRAARREPNPTTRHGRDGVAVQHGVPAVAWVRSTGTRISPRDTRAGGHRCRVTGTAFFGAAGIYGLVKGPRKNRHCREGPRHTAGRKLGGACRT